MNRYDIRPVVAVDIDGTLCDYHGWFLKFAELYFGRPMPDPAANTDGVPLNRWMGVSKAKYRECKLAYRQGGMKRSMPAYEGNAEEIRLMRRSGIQVWICTTRPFLRLDNIDPDTREWLRRNKIQHDGILYGHNKYRELAKIVGHENVLFAVDDLPPMIDQAHKVGIGAYLRDQPYNRYSLRGQRVELLSDIPWREFLRHWKATK